MFDCAIINAFASFAADRCAKLSHTGTGRYTATGLEEAVEQLAAVAVELVEVADQELDAVGVGDQEAGLAQAADVFLALEDQFGRAAVGRHLPGARAGEAGDGGDALDFRDEFAAGQFLLDQPGDGRRQVGQAVGPGDFVAFVIDQRNALIGRGDREGANRRDAFVDLAVFGGQDEATVAIALQLKVGVRHGHSAWVWGSSGERGSDGSVSTLRAWAW